MVLEWILEEQRFVLGYESKIKVGDFTTMFSEEFLYLDSFLLEQKDYKVCFYANKERLL